MLPLYKWSGGKRNEIKLFKEFYPKNYELYIEPFLEQELSILIFCQKSHYK